MHAFILCWGYFACSNLQFVFVFALLYCLIRNHGRTTMTFSKLILQLLFICKLCHDFMSCFTFKIFTSYPHATFHLLSSSISTWHALLSSNSICSSHVFFFVSLISIVFTFFSLCEGQFVKIWRICEVSYFILYCDFYMTSPLESYPVYVYIW